MRTVADCLPVPNAFLHGAKEPEKERFRRNPRTPEAMDLARCGAAVAGALARESDRGGVRVALSPRLAVLPYCWLRLYKLESQSRDESNHS